jgi:nuclear pore complex protein Nup93
VTSWFFYLHIAFSPHIFSLLICPDLIAKIQSIEIQKRVGAFSMALDTINKCLSEAICALSRGRLDGESWTAGLINSGNEILETFKYYPNER